MASSTGRHVLILRGLAATAAILLAIGVTMAASIQGESTTYPGHSLPLGLAFAVAGLSLTAAGLVIRDHQPSTSSLALLAAVVWLAGPLEGWQGGPYWVRTIGMVAGNFTFVVVAHLVIVAAHGSLAGVLRRLVISLYAVTGLASVFLILAGDPFLDPACWANCTPNPYSIFSQPPLARLADDIQTWVVTLAAAGFAGWSLFALLDRDRIRLWEVLPGGLLFSAATVAHGFILWRVPLESPQLTAYRSTYLTQCIGLVLVSLGLCAVLFAAARRRRRVGQIIKELNETPAPGALDQALAAVMNDPGLRISYWLPGAGYFADAHGERVPTPVSNTSSTRTPLVRDGHTVAVISHHTDPAALERHLGPAIRLAIDNERLQAEIRARMRELAESRTRIVETGDARRQTLERNLHDGVQQSLLAMSADMERARLAAESWGDEKAVVLIDGAVRGTREAFRELRALAHGIYPSVLTAAGLCAALGSLVDNDRMAVQVDCRVDGRLPSVVETACYVVAATTVEIAARSSTKRISISVSQVTSSIVIEIDYDGEDITPDLRHLGDRVGAAGGRMTLTDHAVKAEFACG